MILSSLAKPPTLSQGQTCLWVEVSWQRRARVVKYCCPKDECLLPHDQFGGGTRIGHVDGSGESPTQGCGLNQLHLGMMWHELSLKAPRQQAET